MDNGQTFWMQPGNSTVAGDIDALFYFIYYASLVLMALVTAAIVWFIIRYRRRRGEKPGLTDSKAHNTALEITWTVIPTILVFIIFAWGFKSYLRLNIVPANAMEVKVTGQRWFWSFQYPEGMSNVNELVVPEDKPVKLLMSSQDVIHSFFVPNFRIKMDVLPNRYTVAWFEATDTGSYNLFCTEYCGTKHSEMIGTIKVVSQTEYQKWLESAQGPAEGQSMADYGAQLYQTRQCVTCHSVDGSPNTGPTFLNKFGSQEELADGQTILVDENYLRESILEPKAKIVKGYQAVMPTYQGMLNDVQLDALVQYIKSLGQAQSGAETGPDAGTETGSETGTEPEN